MSASLYGENGYYTKDNKVGTKGDFYTSVSASKFFGGAIASYILSLLEDNDLFLPLRIVEIGADKGYLLGDIALFLDALSENVLQNCTFITIEPLSTLAQIQTHHFASLHSSTPLHFATFTNFESCPLPNEPTSLFIISNELFDSFPCEVLDNGKLLSITQDSMQWSGIWQDINALPLHTQDSLQDIMHHITPTTHLTQYSGILPLWQPFITSMAVFAKAHHQSYLMSFDYGGEMISTLTSNPRFYMAHNVWNLEQFLLQNGDFHTLYKQTDITYDVDFMLLDALLRQEGFSLIFRTSQARALIEKMHILALLESFSAQKGFEAYFREIHKVKTLLHTMGERFMGLCYKMRIKSH